MNEVELIAVMPVYNEEASIGGVIREWMEAFRAEGISHRLLAINDGSRDQTLALLESLAAEFPDRLLVIDHPNTGHGRSCRRGYERALAERAPWIYQLDSDGQCDPIYFPEFWRSRLKADCVFGLRVVRDDGLVRKSISSFCRLAVAIVTGRDLKDPNVPYRLMKRSALDLALRQVPADFDLQNIALTLALKRQPSLKWIYLPIRFRARRGGENSIHLGRIIRMGAAMLREIHRVRSHI
ncbi:MAG: glycosyltransferase family 2 protein [Chthoniobacterales bacterium]